MRIMIILAALAAGCDVGALPATSPPDMAPPTSSRSDVAVGALPAIAPPDMAPATSPPDMAPATSPPDMAPPPDMGCAGGFEPVCQLAGDGGARCWCQS